MKKKTSSGLTDKASDVVLVAVTAVITIIVAYPIYYILTASFSDPYDVYAGKTFLLPSKFSFAGYKAVFADSKIFTGYFNSIKYTVAGTVYSVFMLLLVAFPLSRHEMPGRKLISLFFVITMYFGGGLVPTYLVVKNTGLMNTIWALLLPGGVSVANVIIMRNFFETSIPKDMMEAAQIDGASYLRIFWSIVLPLSKSILAVMTVFGMVAYWNDWFTSLIYLNSDMAPLPLVLRNILIRSSASASQASTVSGGYAELNKLTESIKFSSIIVAALPMLIIYPFVQKHFEKGFLSGAIKG